MISKHTVTRKTGSNYDSEWRKWPETVPRPDKLVTKWPGSDFAISPTILLFLTFYKNSFTLTVFIIHLPEKKITYNYESW